MAASSDRTILGQTYSTYSNSVYEKESVTYVEKDSTTAKTDFISRSIMGPIPREDLAKFVEDIDPNSVTWEEDVKKKLAEKKFITVGIHSHYEKGDQNQEMGMTKGSYIKSYATPKTALVIGASVATFFAPAIIAKYFPGAAHFLHLPEYTKDQNAVSYSANTWITGIKEGANQVQKMTDQIPQFILTPALSYIGYQSLQPLVEKAIQYPATDYKTWTALNLKTFLEQVYPQVIPAQYVDDSVLKTIVSPNGQIVRSPFCIDNPAELNRIYEEHVLKKMVSDQKQHNAAGKLFCPIDGKTEMQDADVKRNTLLADRVELRLLLLDARAFKQARESQNQEPNKPLNEAEFSAI